MKFNLEIDYDAADKIAVSVLKNYRDSLIQSLKIIKMVAGCMRMILFMQIRWFKQLIL